MIRPMNVDTSLDRDNDGLFFRRSGLSKERAAGSSATVTVYECRRDGMVTLLIVVRHQDGSVIQCRWTQLNPTDGLFTEAEVCNQVRINRVLRVVSLLCPAPVHNLSM